MRRLIRKPETQGGSSVDELHGTRVENAFGGHVSGFFSRDGGEESAVTRLKTHPSLDVQGGRTSVTLALDTLSESPVALAQLPPLPCGQST